MGGLVPGNFAADASFTAQDTLGGERVIDSSREGAVVHNEESRTATALSLTSTQPLGDCHHKPKWPIACTDTWGTSDGHFQGFCAPCPVCEWHYRRGIDEFYSDMPSLEAGLDFDKPYDCLGLDESYDCMPEL